MPTGRQGAWGDWLSTGPCIVPAQGHSALRGSFPLQRDGGASLGPGFVPPALGSQDMGTRQVLIYLFFHRRRIQPCLCQALFEALVTSRSYPRPAAPGTQTPHRDGPIPGPG